MGSILGSGVDIIQDLGLFVFRILDAVGNFLGVSTGRGA